MKISYAFPNEENKIKWITLTYNPDNPQEQERAELFKKVITTRPATLEKFTQMYEHFLKITPYNPAPEPIKKRSSRS